MEKTPKSYNFKTTRQSPSALARAPEGAEPGAAALPSPRRGRGPPCVSSPPRAPHPPPQQPGGRQQRQVPTEQDGCPGSPPTPAGNRGPQPAQHPGNPGLWCVACPVSRPPPRLNSFPRLYFDFPSKAGKQQALSGHERRAQQPGLIPSFKKPVGDAAGRSSRRLITTATTAIGARTGRRRVRRYFPHAPRCPRPKVAQSTGRSGLPCPGQARGAGSEPPEGAGCGVPPARAGGLR